MLEELQRRNYATTTVQYYIQAVERFAKCFRRPPDQLNQSPLRTYQAYLLRERKLGPRTVKLHVSALRFFFVKTLKRPYMLEDIPFPKVPRRLPAILTTEEVARLIDGARNLFGAELPGQFHFLQPQPLLFPLCLHQLRLNSRKVRLQSPFRLY